MVPLPNPIPSSVAAVDLGSNSFHMIICNLNNGKLQVIDRMKEMVRLAAGLDDKKNLSQDAQQRAIACLERFGQRIRNFPPHSVSIVGTNTLRQARNAPEFLSRAEQALGHPIHIISGIEEARLIYQGVAHSLAGNGNQRFVMDIGGSSTEYIIGQHDVAHTKESLNMGCVTVSRLFENGVITKKNFTKACLFAEQQLEPFLDTFNSRNFDEAIGASGSLKAVERVLRENGWSNNGITLDGLEILVERLLGFTHVDQIQFAGLSEERQPVFIGAVAIIYATFKDLNIRQMTVSDGALREGLIHDLLGRIYNHDIRSDTVRMIAERYHTDRRHSAQMKQTVHYMAEQLSQHACFIDNDESLAFLEWACDLHTIGIEIAHNQFQKHSAYIIENGDFAGFSRQDQKILATLVRNHRKKLGTQRFDELPAPWHQHGPVLAIVLRLAALIHRNRHTARPEFALTLRDKQITLCFQTGWLNQAPLTCADLKQEAAYLADAKFQLIFS
jgi:exopolyphosphatase / guanosine-5'-triphosphate,3'-diphosphate pyrophosphatase